MERGKIQAGAERAGYKLQSTSSTCKAPTHQDFVCAANNEVVDNGRKGFRFRFAVLHFFLGSIRLSPSQNRVLIVFAKALQVSKKARVTASIHSRRCRKEVS